MFFQQADFDRHFNAHQKPVAESRSVQCQTQSDQPDGSDFGHKSCSSSEQQDSPEAAGDAATVDNQQTDSYDADSGPIFAVEHSNNDPIVEMYEIISPEVD
jgi:hypothetical protein